MSKLRITTTYGVTPNHVLNDPNLSMKAKGLFAYMQSKPDKWNFSTERISIQTKESKDAIKTGIAELEKAGFLQRKARRNEKGEWDGYDYILTEKPFAVNSSKVKPPAENHPPFSKKEGSKKDKVKSIFCTSVQEEEKSSSPQVEEVRKIGHEEIVEAISKFEKVFPSQFLDKKAYKIPATRDIIAKALESYSPQEIGEIAEAFLEVRSEKYCPNVSTIHGFIGKMDQIVQFIEKEKKKAPRKNVSDTTEPGDLEQFQFLGALTHDVDTPLLDAVTDDVVYGLDATEQSWDWVRAGLYLSAALYLRFWREGDRPVESMHDLYWKAFQLEFRSMYTEGQYVTNCDKDYEIWKKKYLEVVDNINMTPYTHYPFFNQKHLK